MVSLFFTFYVLVWYDKLETRRNTPKEHANALNLIVLPELFFAVPMCIFHIFGGFYFDALLFAVPALWITIRFALGWSELEPTEVFDRSKFRHAEAYTKMAWWFGLLIWCIMQLSRGMAVAYRSHRRGGADWAAMMAEQYRNKV